MFCVNWPFDSGEEEQNRFSRWWPSLICDRRDFSYFLAIFYLQLTQMLPTKFRVILLRGVGVGLFVLRFYGPVNPMGSCRAWSVYLTTRYWAGLVL